MNEVELFEELKKATDALRLAESETAHARSRETDALNRLNKVQQEITALMLEMKKSAPRSSDWCRSNLRSSVG